MTIDTSVDIATDTITRMFVDAAGADGDATKALDDFGVAEFILSNPAVVVPALFAAQGRSVARSDCLHHLLAGTLARVLVDAGRVGTVLLPLSAHDGLDGTLPSDRPTVVMSTREGAPGPAIFAVRGDDGGVELRILDDGCARLIDGPGLDERLGQRSCEVNPSASHPLGTPSPTDSWRTAIAWARLALAAEILGSAEAMLESAVAYASDRRQFGQPIAAFQAVQHRLAETYAFVEAASDLVRAVAEKPTLATSAVAKAFAGKAGMLANRHCLQVLGGMGFTWEHPLHLHLRRQIVLDRVLGAPTELSSCVGRRLLEDPCMPAFIDL